LYSGTVSATRLSERAIISMLAVSSKNHLAP
jgi:hypothetical protein